MITASSVALIPRESVCCGKPAIDNDDIDQFCSGCGEHFVAACIECGAPIPHNSAQERRTCSGRCEAMTNGEEF